MWIDDVGFTLVDLKKLAYLKDPFIIAEPAKHVFYVQHHCDERWSVVLHEKTISVNIEDDDSYIDTMLVLCPYKWVKEDEYVYLCLSQSTLRLDDERKWWRLLPL